MGVRVSSSSHYLFFENLDIAEKAEFLCKRAQKVYFMPSAAENAKFRRNAEIAQLVEHNLAKVGVAGPSPVFRSFLG